MVRQRLRSGMVLVCVSGFLSACTPTPRPETATADGFTGSARCQPCHPVEYRSWQESWHSKIVLPGKEAILKEAVEKWASDGVNPGPTVGNATGETFTLDDVQYVVGSRWEQRFLVKNAQTGNLQFLDKQMIRASGRWEPYGQKNDWNGMCAACHTTGYRITAYDNVADRTVASEFVELGVGCEACHGPGAQHVRTLKKRDIFNAANVNVQEQTRACGYCHVRGENMQWKSDQGHPREDLPAPKLGECFVAGADWSKWYPAGVVIPGVTAGSPFDKEYSGELQGLFRVDDFSRKNGVYEETRHHQQYQGFIQSSHYKTNIMSCVTCHSPHAGQGKIKKIDKDSCGKCHTDEFTVEKYMPNTGRTADNLFVRSHTFIMNPRRGGLGNDTTTPPNYYGE